MKCGKCGEEVTVQLGKSANFCFNCGNKIEAEKTNNWKYFDNTKDLLAHIATEYGLDALFSKKYLSDHASPSLPQGQKRLVSEVFSCDAVKILQKNMTANQKNREVAFKQAVKKLTDLMFSQEAAEQVIWEFTNAIGWGLPEPNISSSVSPQAQPNPQPSIMPQPIISSSPIAPSVDALITRAWLFAEDGDWKDSTDYFNKVLDISPTYAPAYLGLICVDLKIAQEDKLANIKDPGNITNHKYYRRVIVDSAVKTRLDGYIQIINDRIDAEQKAAAAEAERKRKAAEEAARRKRIQDAFDNADKIMKAAKSPEDYRKAITAFGSIDSNYQDINNQLKSRIAECERLKKELEEIQKTTMRQASIYKLVSVMRQVSIYKLISVLKQISKKKAVAEEAERKRRAAEEAARRKRVQDAFDNAAKIMNGAQSPDDYRKAITAFGSIDSNYQDINNQIKSKIAECGKKIEAIVAAFRNKYGVLLDRLSAEGKAQAGQRHQAAQLQLDEENKKVQAYVEAKCAQIKKKYDANHKAWQDEYNRLKSVYDAKYKKWEAEASTIKSRAEQWKSQGLCPHDGGTLKGLLTKKCTECGKTPSEPIKTPIAPTQPNYPAEPRMPQTPTYTPRRLEIETDLPADVVATIRGEFVFVKLGGIDWRVLTVENNRALLISEKSLEKRPYNIEYKNITWEACTLRTYLNGEFYNKLGAAKSAIAETRHSNSNNPWYGTAGGNATTDKVFLLSLDELVKYFGDSGDLRNKRRKDFDCNLKSDGYYLDDQYNSARIANYGSEGASWWWLRSPGGDSFGAARVDGGGGVRVGGLGVSIGSGGVRPVLWLNL